MRPSRITPLVLTLIFFAGPRLRGQSAPAAHPGATKKEPLYVWSAQEGVTLRVNPSATASAAVGPPTGFLEPYQVLEVRRIENAGMGSEWFLVSRRVLPGSSPGWLERRQVLTGLDAEINTESNVAKKVVIVNTVMSLQTPGAEEFVDVPIRKSPMAVAPKSGTLRVLDLAFRYAAANGFVLVGPEPRFDPTADGGWPIRAIAGWVPEDLTIPFDGQMAAAWARDTTLPRAELRRLAEGRIYRDHRDAYASLKEPRSALFEEQADEDHSGLELLPAGPRMPILSFVEKEGYPEVDFLTNNHLIRVAGIGALLAPSDLPPTRAEANQIQSELDRLGSRLSSALQVLFVIDDTQSMRDQFPRVAETVRRIIDDVTRTPGRTVEVAVSYYDDFQEGPPGYHTMSLVDARSPACRILLNEVATHGNRLVNGVDFLEMVADGLEHALDDAHFEARRSRSARLTDR